MGVSPALVGSEPPDAPQEESVIAADETATPSATPQQETTQIVEEQEGKINIVKYEGPEQANLYAEAFETPEDKAKRRKIELVVSGNASDGPQEQLIFNRPMYVQSATAPTKTGITETGPSDYSIPVTLGAGVKFSLTEKWALGAGLSYTIAGREFAGIYTKIKSGSEPFRESFSKIRNTQNYIGLNINAYYSFININWLDFYAYGGFGADKCISNHFQMFDKTNKYTYKDSTGGIQFSVKLGVGVEFLVSDFIGIYLDPSVSYYIPNASMPKSLRTKNPFLPAAEIGLRFKL
jgi:opacity protein-like surface antigen